MNIIQSIFTLVKAIVDNYIFPIHIKTETVIQKMFFSCSPCVPYALFSNIISSIFRPRDNPDPEVISSSVFYCHLSFFSYFFYISIEQEPLMRSNDESFVLFLTN